jgi:hypothetical protein
MGKLEIHVTVVEKFVRKGSHGKPRTWKYIEYSTYSTVHTVQYLQYSTYSTVHTVQCIEYSTYRTVHTVQYIQYSTYSTEHTVGCESVEWVQVTRRENKCGPKLARASSFTRFLDHTQRRTTLGRTPLDE